MANVVRARVAGGGWFNLAAAIRFEERLRWDGRNMISVATGSQWHHERLYRSRKGAWYLRSWSDWQGSGAPVYEQISAREAADWLVGNGQSQAAEEHCGSELAEGER
jgi:hypothetical protein